MISLRAVKNNRKIGWIKYKYLSNARTFLRLLVKKRIKIFNDDILKKLLTFRLLEHIIKQLNLKIHKPAKLKEKN